MLKFDVNLLEEGEVWERRVLMETRWGEGTRHRDRAIKSKNSRREFTVFSWLNKHKGNWGLKSVDFVLRPKVSGQGRTLAKY